MVWTHIDHEASRFAPVWSSNIMDWLHHVFTIIQNRSPSSFPKTLESPFRRCFAEPRFSLHDIPAKYSPNSKKTDVSLSGGLGSLLVSSTHVDLTQDPWCPLR